MAKKGIVNNLLYGKGDNKDFTTANLPSTRRKQFFYIFKRNYYFPRYAATAELLYRDAFMNGDTKISIGNKKTIFVSSSVDANKMKMPFLIPYNKKIIIQDRR